VLPSPGNLHAAAAASIGPAAAARSPRIGSAPASAAGDHLAGPDISSARLDASAAGLDPFGTGLGGAPPPGSGTPPLPSGDTGGGGSRPRRLLFAGLGVLSVLVLVMAVVIVARSGDDGGGNAAPSTSEPGSWTVLVYQMADNDLENAALMDLEEMAAAGASEDLNLIVMSDRSGEADPEAGYSADGVLNIGDWVGAKTFEVGAGELIELEDHGETNMVDPATLGEFVETGFKDYPADNRAVVLWDHGGGWVGMGPDESAASEGLLSLPLMEQGLEDGLGGAGVDQLDLVGFDACLMATYEVGQAMAPMAEFMVASQELEPGHGWDWSSFGVLADGNADPVELGSSILAGYQQQAQSFGTEAGITLSMVDLGRLDAVSDDLDALAGRVESDIEASASVLGQERAQNLRFGASPDPEADPHLTDLGQLTEGLAQADGEPAPEAEEASSSLDDAVVETVAGPGADGASGLSVYFPPSREDLSADESGDYGDIQDETWAPILEAYYEAGETIPEDEVVSFDDGEEAGPGPGAEYAFEEDGVTISGTFAQGNADNLSEAIVSYGLPLEDGSLVYFGEEPGNIYEDGTADAFFDLTTLVVSDGVDTLDAYLALGYDEESDTVSIDVPFVYYPPDEGGEIRDLVLSIVLDPDFNILSETYYAFQEGGTLSEFTADPTGLIYPVLPVVAPDGTEEWVDYSDVGLFADIPSLTYDFVPFESGEEIYVELGVIDYGGNGDAIAFVDVVP
jgi:hypothetical protein